MSIYTTARTVLWGRYFEVFYVFKKSSFGLLVEHGILCVVRMELMDYLDSIDCSLEDFQAVLYGKQFGLDFDAFEVK